MPLFKKIPLSQLDGEGQRIMDQQQQMHIKESVKENLLKQTAATKMVNVSALRNLMLKHKLIELTTCLDRQLPKGLARAM